ncbi:MAG: hypothetical protein M1820_007960 [Bogoriella megaspora]|nr:MAG: hypothetical protein M1820_007960 [Bogoriella megaspora]
MGDSFEDAKAKYDESMDDKKRHSTVPSTLGDDEKNRWSGATFGQNDVEKGYPDEKKKKPKRDLLEGIEVPQNEPPPPQVFPSYPPPTRRWGVFIPWWLLALIILLFLFESSIIFVYTIVGLWKETAPVVLSAAGLANGCNCGTSFTQAGVNAQPNVVMPSYPTITVHDTPTNTQLAQPPIRPTSVSTDSTVSTTTAPGTTTTASASTSVSTATITSTPSASTTTHDDSSAIDILSVDAHNLLDVNRQSNLIKSINTDGGGELRRREHENDRLGPPFGDSF